VIPPVNGQNVDGGKERGRELSVGAVVLLIEDRLLDDGEAGMHDTEIEVD